MKEALPMDPSLRIEALLPAPYDAVQEVVAHRARDIGFDVVHRASGLFIALLGGDLDVSDDNGQTRVIVTAQDVPHLQMLRDFMTEEIGATGLTPDWLGHRAIGRPDSHALVRVAAVDRISPSYARVTVEGDVLERFETGGLHFSILLGPKGAGWPMTDANGVTQWPEGIAAWHKPIYTTRNLYKVGDTKRLDFDVFLHEGGRVTTWCNAAKVGTEIVLIGPGGNKSPKTGGWQGLVGDETAVPVIARTLAQMPPDAQGQVVLVVPQAGDIQPLEHPPGVTVQWDLRDAGGSPLHALDMLKVPPQDRRVFFAAEKSEALVARKTLAALGLERSEVTAVGYWLRKAE